MLIEFSFSSIILNVDLNFWNPTSNNENSLLIFSKESFWFAELQLITYYNISEGQKYIIFLFISTKHGVNSSKLTSLSKCPT